MPCHALYSMDFHKYMKYLSEMFSAILPILPLLSTNDNATTKNKSFFFFFFISSRLSYQDSDLNLFLFVDPSGLLPLLLLVGKVWLRFPPVSHWERDRFPFGNRFSASYRHISYLFLDSIFHTFISTIKVFSFPHDLHQMGIIG